MKAKLSFAAGGKSDAKDEVEDKTIVYTDEIITAAEGSGKPVKLKRTYTKYDVLKDGKNLDGAPLDSPILIEKKDGKYTFTCQKELSPGFEKKLVGEFERDAGAPSVEKLLPGKPVKPGETWKIDVSKLPGLAGNEGLVVDADASELTGKLVKTYQKGGKQFGVLEFTGHLAIKSFGPKSPVKLKAGSKMGIKMTAEGCIDGTDPSGTTKGSLSIKVDGDGGGISISVAGEGTMTSTEELLPKK
jgi:hypothetical protein